MIRTTVDDAQTRLRDLVDAALRGEEVVITTNAEQVQRTIRLVADEVRKPRQPREFGSARGLLVVPDNFDDPLDEFAEYQDP